MKTFIACLIIVSGYVLLSKIRSNKEIRNNTAEASPVQNIQQIAFYDIERLIDDLSEKKMQLETIENMITDIESCDPAERATAFNISMPANNNSVSLLANNSSDNILNLLYAERQAVRSSIVNSVSILSGMCQENVKKTSVISYSRGVITHE